MRGIFEDELRRLTTKFTEMEINTNEQIYHATKSFLNHDRALAQQVIADDDKINNQEVALEDEALNIIALQHPFATDFRQVIVVLKASSELERIADHATGIAKEAIRIKGHQRNLAFEEQIGEMTNVIRTMLDVAIDALVKQDSKLTQEVLTAKQKIHDDFHKLREQLLVDMKENPKSVSGDTGYLLVANYMKRISEHIINLVEWILYNKTGKITDLNHDDTELDEI